MQDLQAYWMFGGAIIAHVVHLALVYADDVTIYVQIRQEWRGHPGVVPQLVTSHWI